MYRIIDKNIYVNRGDAMTIIVANNSDSFKVNDIIKFYVCEQGNFSNVLLSKTITVAEESAEVEIHLESEDTRIGDVLRSGSKVYWYEIELNGDTTLVGYDNNGPKLFTLWPEAVEGDD
jgi:hypothetical protein